MMRARPRVVRRTAAAVRDKGVTVTYRNGLVDSIDTGAAADGADALFVTVGGDTIAAPYLASYSPRTVGDLVRVQFVGGSPLILGHIVGLPDF